jgi:hypothetical protein
MGKEKAQILNIRNQHLIFKTRSYGFSKNHLSRAEQILRCDVEHFAQAKSLSGAEKDIRDVMLYCILISPTKRTCTG